MWLFYLAGAEAAFRYGGMVNWQVQICEAPRSIPMTRDYMYEERRGSGRWKKLRDGTSR